MKKPKQFIDEKTRSLFKKTADYVYGVVYVSDDYIELGWFKSAPDNIMVLISEGRFKFDSAVFPGISREALPSLIWSNKTGYYMTPKSVNSKLIHEKVYGQGNFPYQFPKLYEAADSFHLFNGNQKVINEFYHPLADHLDYTFGLEFETSMGYVPQEICFRDGLIPLRDGSISGIEYSTVVLEGNKGLCLLKQELDTLQKYTKFNKECALHIHMGNYPVNPIDIYALYNVWFKIERDLIHGGYIPNFSFNTGQYKANGKDYCKMLTGKSSCFEEYFTEVTGRPYLGSLTQPHPADIEKRAKWNIKSRYYGLNLVNMLCYKGAKTVEFRFLRPTFNYRKIILWLYIFNAVLKFAEFLGQKWREQNNCPDNTEGMLGWVMREPFGVRSVVQKIYGHDQELVNHLMGELDLLQLLSDLQYRNGDSYGRDIFFEDELFT